MAGCKRSASNSLEVLAAVLAESDDISFEEHDSDCSPPGRHCIEQFLPTIGLAETWRNESTDVVPEDLLVSEERSGVPCPSRPFFHTKKPVKCHDLVSNIRLDSVMKEGQRI